MRKIQLNVSALNEPQDPVICKLCSMETCHIPPLKAVPIKVSPESPTVDGDYVVSPNMHICFPKQLSIAHSIVSILDGSTSIGVVNLGRSPQLLPRRTSLAVTSPLFEEPLSVITDNDRPTPNLSPPLASDLV